MSALGAPSGMEAVNGEMLQLFTGQLRNVADTALPYIGAATVAALIITVSVLGVRKGLSMLTAAAGGDYTGAGGDVGVGYEWEDAEYEEGQDDHWGYADEAQQDYEAWQREREPSFEEELAHDSKYEKDTGSGRDY